MGPHKGQTFHSDTLLTSYQVGALLQVNPSSVNKWVRDGRLPAFRTPGGHRRIRVFDLLHFVLAHNMPLPPALGGLVTRHVVFVSDDNHLILTLKTQLLTQHHPILLHHVLHTTDALVAIGELRPQVLMLDTTSITDPLDTLVKRLLLNPATANLRIILVIDNHDEGHRSTSWPQHQSIQFLTKPVEMAAWLSVIDGALLQA